MHFEFQTQRSMVNSVRIIGIDTLTAETDFTKRILACTECGMSCEYVIKILKIA